MTIADGIAASSQVRGVLVHGLRHTYATELANSEVSVYTLMKLLGHESMATSQRYVVGAARETRTAAAQNPLYGVMRDRSLQPEKLDGDSHQLTTVEESVASRRAAFPL